MKTIKQKLRGIIALSVLAVFISLPAKSQSAIDLRINEFLVINDSNFVDDFGIRNPWIEVFNTAYNTVNIGGLYLTNDLSNPTKYLIPKGQPITSIAPRSFIVFWADAHPTRGVLHLNFDLRESSLIALFDANGRTLIDSVSIPKNTIADQSYGHKIDGEGNWCDFRKTTPGASNVIEAGISPSEQFLQLDPTGVGMIVIAMSVVFSALATLYIFFKYMGKLLNRRKTRKKVPSGTEPAEIKVDEELSGEVNAAIALALYMYLGQLHDNEMTVLTINKVSKTYSPWSSKIYGLRKFPGN